MKKINQLISIILLTYFLSCVKTDDFNIPKIDISEPEITANSNIKAVKSAHKQSGEEIYTFGDNDNSVIEGYVISSDEGGNFYKTLVIQDNYKNPDSGIEILIDLKSYFTKFNFGRKIFVKMSGLSISNNNGKFKIGYNIRNKMKEIPQSLIDAHIIRSIEFENIIPSQITFAEISDEMLDIYVQCENIQFKKEEIGKTYAGEEFDEFNGERILIQCDNLITAILSTSTFSDFKSNLISNKSGSIIAVLTKDFYAEKFVLVYNDLTNLKFNEEERCDPDFLNCATINTSGSKLLFFENFEEIKKTKDLDDLGWTNTNVYFGNEKFNKRSSQGNVSMQISAYDTNENPLEVWLITPGINLDNSINEILTFDTKASFDTGSVLSAWVSTDFIGNIDAATWQQLDVNISVGPRSDFENKYITSGEISLDCLDGDVSIAFKYLGADPGITTTYEIDNVLVIGFDF